MDHPLSLPQDQTALDDLLGRTRMFVLSVANAIEDHLPTDDTQSLPAALIRLLMRRFLIPAEAAMRRAILLIAATRALPAAPAPAARPSKEPPKPARKEEGPSAPCERAPAFNMNEPRPRPKTGAIPQDQLPRITVLDDAALTAPGAPPKALRPAPGAAPSAAEAVAALTRRFFRRLDALSAVIGNPGPAADRWLKSVARKAALQPEATTPPPPLAFHKIPGQTKAAGTEAISLLNELNAAVLALLPSAPNTS
jgi:hypothetical protein